MIEKIRIPSDSSGCGDVSLVYDGAKLGLKFDYFSDGKLRDASIILYDVISFSISSEPVAQITADIYDFVVSTQESSWLHDVLDKTKLDELRHSFYHYTSYISNFGRVDAIARSVRTTF